MASDEFTRELLRERSRLFGFLLAIVRDFDLAEELFQEISLRILKQEDRFKPGTDFGAWVREIARRTMLEEWREQGRVQLSAGAIAAIAGRYDRSYRDESESKRRALARCREKLDTSARELLVLRYEQGFNMKKIGERLRRKSGAIQVALFRIRSELLQCIRRQLSMEETA